MNCFYSYCFFLGLFFGIDGFGEWEEETDFEGELEESDESELSLEIDFAFLGLLVLKSE